jgi:methyl-accepting chemotaxis protein
MLHMLQTKKRHRRKPVNLRVKLHLQTRLLGRLGILLLLCVTTGAAVFYLSGSHELGNTWRMAHLRIRSVQELLLPVLGIAAGLALILGFGASLLFPLHVVGPLPRLEAVLRRIGSGDLTARVNLRDGDILDELGGVLNEMTSGLRERLRTLQSQAAELSQEAERLHRVGEERPEIRELIEPLSTTCRRLSRDLAEFRTGD